MTVLLTVKNIFATKLIGVVPWANVAVTNCTGQELYADVETPKGHRYKLAVKSSYSAPPLGAVTLFDGTDPKNPSELVHGQNQDATWHRAVEYIKAKEGGSSADAAAKVAAVIPEHLQVTAAVVSEEVDVPFPPMVYFIAGRGEFYRNGPALVTRRYPDGTLNITVFADGSDPFYVQNVQPRSDELRNLCFIEYGRPDEAVKQMIADVLDVTKFDCSEAVNEALQAALPDIVAAVKEALAAAPAKLPPFPPDARVRVDLSDPDNPQIIIPERMTEAEAAAQAKSAEQVADEAFIAGEQWGPEQVEQMKRGGVPVVTKDAADLSLEELERLTAPDPDPKA